jgi:hypothetical protein
VTRVAREYLTISYNKKKEEKRDLRDCDTVCKQFVNRNILLHPLRSGTLAEALSYQLQETVTEGLEEWSSRGVELLVSQAK